MVTKLPSVSIITVVKNHREGLRETVDSLMSQTFSDWELLIIIGKSEDGTEELAFKYESQDPRIFARLELGSGIYPAMNQGIQMTKSPLIWFMNAGDLFASAEVLDKAQSEISISNHALLIGGYQVREELDRTYVYSARKMTPLRFALNTRGGCHQAMIFRKAAIVDLGGFDESFLLAADFKLVLRIIKNFTVKRVSTIFAIIESGGASETGIKKVHSEKHFIRIGELGGFHIRMLSYAWTLLVQSKMRIRRIFPKN